MKDRFPYIVQYQDVDQTRHLRLHTFLSDCVLNVAGKAADKHGFGICDLLPYGWTWIITKVCVQLACLPEHGTQMEVETWVERNAHMLSMRNYRYYVSDNGIRHETGKAHTEWAILDLKKREIVNVFDMPMFNDSVDGDTIPNLQYKRFPYDIRDGEYAASGQMLHQVCYADVDYNGHCNSARYLEHMLNTYLPDLHHSPIQLDINYQKETRLGDELITYYAASDKDVYYQQIAHNGVPVCRASVTFLEEMDC